MTDPREPLGRLVHEQRLAHNAELDRPFVLEPWETRSPRQRELDMLIGAAVRDRVLNAGPGRGELVRETWVYWALEQPDIAEHPNWLKSWAELDERDREVDDRIYAAVAAVVRERIAVALEDYAGNYPEDTFPPDGTSRDAIGGTAMRFAYRNAGRIARETQDRSGEKESP